MSKYKIRPYREGFKVWYLRDMGSGYSWDDVKMVFRSREQAEQYIEEQKRGDKHEGIS